LGEEDTISKNKETINKPAIAAPISIDPISSFFFPPADSLARQAPHTLVHILIGSFQFFLTGFLMQTDEAGVQHKLD
jgi:hypothetical protein